MTKSLSFIKKHGRAMAMTVAFVLVSAFFFFAQGLLAGPPQANVFDGLSVISSTEDTASWGPNFGWVSFNCDNVSGNTCSTVEYGANLDLNTGVLSGQGWSNNLGWVSFDAAHTSVCDTQPTAKLVSGDYSESSIAFKGWARAIVAPTASNDFWNGCISLSYENPGSTGPVQYVVRYIPSTGDITGVGWGSELIGWLRFAAHIDVSAPTVDLIATPQSIVAGETTELSWVASAEVVDCTAVTVDDPNWSPALQISVPTGSWMTGPLLVDTTYEIDCSDSQGNHVTDSVTVDVNQFPISLSALPTVVLPDLNNQTGYQNSFLTWSSGQTFSACFLNRYDNGTPDGFSISVPAPLTTNYEVEVPHEITNYQVECTSPTYTLSNPVTIYQDQPSPEVTLIGQGCVVEDNDPAWIAWEIIDIGVSSQNECTLTRVQNGATEPITDSGGYPVVAPWGTYELSCPNPLGGTISDTTDIVIGGPSCIPTTPPGTPDPDIIFEEF